jgi:hypothetical protein
MAVNLKAVLKFDGKAYEAGMRKASGLAKKTSKKIAGSLKGAIIGTLSAGYMAAKAKEVGEFAQQVSDLAPALGMTTDELQQWEYVFARVGLEIADVVDAMATLSDRVEDALSGTQSMIEDFRLIGITVDQLRGKNPQQLFELFADAVQKTTDKNRSLTAIVRNLGDDLGRKLVPVLMKGSDGLRELRKEAEDLGIVLDSDKISDITEKMVKLQIVSLRLRSTWAELTSAFSNLVDFGQRAFNLLDFTGPLGGAFGEAVGGWENDRRSDPTSLKRWADVLPNLWKGWKKVINERNRAQASLDSALSKKEANLLGGGSTRAAGGINDELNAIKAKEAYQKKVNDAVFKGLDNEGKLNALLEKRAVLMDRIRNASGKNKYELMGEQFDIEQQMESLKTGTSATGRRTQSLTGAQGVGAFVRRANPMLQVARQQLQIQRESKFVLDAILASGYRPAYGPY